MKDLNIYEEQRPWGRFRQFVKNASATVKVISINPMETLSLQSHAKRDEFWRVIRGGGIVEIAGKKRAVKVGDECEVPQGARHRASAGKDGLEMLEIATGDFDEGDIVRFEDKYGRK